MASVVLTGDTSGQVTLSAPAVAGTNTVTLPAATGTSQLIGTSSVSASGSSIDFLNIPSWAKQITVMLSGVSSTSASGAIDIYLGTSSGIESTGYSGASFETSTALASSGTANLYSTTFEITSTSSAAANNYYGQAILSYIGSNSWVMTSVTSPTTSGTTAKQVFGAGGKTTAATLDRVRVASSAGTFDAGTITVMWMG